MLVELHVPLGAAVAHLGGLRAIVCLLFPLDLHKGVSEDFHGKTGLRVDAEMTLPIPERQYGPNPNRWAV